MSIILHTGRPRQGKTYGLVRDVIKNDLNKGRKVWSNILLNWKGHTGRYFNWRKFRFEKYEIPADNLQYWTKLSDLYEVREGVILMDEAHAYMSSRKWKDLPEQMVRKLAQHGKQRLDIKATVQHINRIDVIVRELVDFWYVYYKGLFFFHRYEFDIDQDKVKKYPLSFRIVPKRKKWYLSYNSYAEIVPGKALEQVPFEIYDDSF